MINYFELYELPVSLKPDAAVVKNKFYELSRRYHPDRFTLAEEATRAEALRMAAINNDAYKTLTSEDATLAYVLKMNSVLEDEEKYTLPPDFLMEMMELNEAVSDYEMEPDNISLKEQATTALQTQLNEWKDVVAPLAGGFESNPTDKKILLQLKDFHFRKKYLLRIQERLATFAAH